MIPYDPSRKTYTNDLHRSDYQSKGWELAREIVQEQNDAVERLLDEMYRDRSRAIRTRARRAAQAYARRFARAHTDHGRVVFHVDRAVRNFDRLMKLVAGLA